MVTTISSRASTREGQIKESLYVWTHSAGGDPSNFHSVLLEALKSRPWGDDKNFRRYWEARYPEGVSIKLDALKALVNIPCRFPDIEQHRKWMRDEVLRLCGERTEPLPERGAPTGNQNAAKNKVDISTLNKTPGGTSREYIIARLKRDAPELAERVTSGELTANKAAELAGFRKKPSPLDAALRAWSRLNNEERAEFRRVIDEQP